MDAENFRRIFEYMNIGQPADSDHLVYADGALVFCREDFRIAAATATLFQRGLIEYAVLTGGVGKDSGALTVPEAVHQYGLLIGEGVSSRCLYVEPTARNGAENSRLGIDAIRATGRPHDRLILVVHPHSALRVFATHDKITRDEKGFIAEYQVVSMAVDFDPEDPATQRELVSEFLRVIDWPAKGWSDPQPPPPDDLIAWARKAQAAFTATA